MFDTSPTAPCPRGETESFQHHDEPGVSATRPLWDHAFAGGHDPYIPADFANPYLDDLDTSFYRGHLLHATNSHLGYPQSSSTIPPPIRAPPSPTGPTLTAMTEPNSHTVLPQAIDQHTVRFSTYADEALISPLALADAWQPWAPLGEPPTESVLDQYFPESNYPTGGARTILASINDFIPARLDEGSRTSASGTEGRGTPPTTPGLDAEATSPRGRKRASKSGTIDKDCTTDGIRFGTGQPSQPLFALEPLEDDAVPRSTNMLQARTILDGADSYPLTIDPFTGVHEEEDRRDHCPSSDQQNLIPTTTTTRPMASRPTIFSDTRLYSTMNLTPVQVDLHNTRARNRVAANRCRARQRDSIAKLKETERMVIDERERLLDLRNLLTDQVCALKEELFMHAKCKEDRLIGEYLKLTATRIVDMARETAEQQQQVSPRSLDSTIFADEETEGDS